MPSCACGGVRVCSLHCKRERDRHLQQHLKETHQILKKREEINTQQPRHHGLYTLHIESVSCAGDISTNSIAQVMLACKR